MRTESHFPIQDKEDPNRCHVVTGSTEAIAALQETLKERFRDGRNLGKAEAEDRITALESFLARVKFSMDYYAPDDVFLMDDGLTIQDAIAAILDRHEGEQRLPLDLSA